MYTNSNLNDYFRSYCWIHGTAYIREHLQGKATGCFVDQSRIESEEDAPVSLSMMYMMVDMKGLVLEKMDKISIFSGTFASLSCSTRCKKSYYFSCSNIQNPG